MTEQQVIQWLEERDNFLILTHVRPDGDTLGSAVALTRALQNKGKTAYMLKNNGVTRTFEGFLDCQWAEEGYQPEHVIAVDIATEGLLPAEAKGYAGNIELCIDHHPSNTRYAKNLCLVEDAAACGEIVCRICEQMGAIDETIAQALYIAVSTDCGCFVYSNTSAETHRIAARLLELTDVSDINKHFFRTKSAKELKLEGMLMQSEEFFEEGKVCIGVITVADKESVNADEGDCEELSSFAAMIEGVQCAATLRELTPNQWKLSVRSDPSYANANKICGVLGGGGHPAASGASLPVPTSKEDAKKLVYDVIFSVIKG